MGIYLFHCEDCKYEWEDGAVEYCPVCGSKKLLTIELPSNRLQDIIRIPDWR